jgi:hypothetical protein
VPRSIAVGVLSLLALTGISLREAGAREFTRDPCPLLSTPTASAGLKAEFARLSARAMSLDSTTAAFNARCNVENPEGEAAEIACKQEEADLQKQIEQHDREIESFNRSLAAEADGEIRRLQGRMAGTAAKMRQAMGNSEEWQREAEDWIELGAQARHQAQVATVFEELDLATEAVAEAARQNIELSAEMLRRFKAWYDGYGQIFPYAERARILARIRDLRTVKDMAELLGILGTAQASMLGAREALEDAQYRRAVGEAVVGVLRIAQSALSADPRLKLAVTVVDLSLEDGYAVLAGREARVRVDQLLTLQDGNLRAIDALGRLYVEDVRKLKAVKQARAGLVADACFAS